MIEVAWGGWMRTGMGERWTGAAVRERRAVYGVEGDPGVPGAAERIAASAAVAGARAPDSDDVAGPSDDAFELGERCAEAYMQADALHYRAMTLLARFHHLEGWKDTGFGSTAEWLAWRVGIKLGAARERVRTALALERLPETAKAMANGALSFTKARALTRVARPENETVLLELAQAGSAAHLERIVRGWKQLDRRSEVQAEQIRYGTRRFSAFVDEDGMVVVRGRLDPEAGAMLMRAVEAAGDALFRQDPEEDPARRRADALGLMSERALAAGFDADRAPLSGSRAERTQVVLYVDESTLAEDQEPGQSELEDGTRLAAETSRRICCDTGVVRMVRDDEGNILDVGRRTRTVPTPLRRVLEARDRGCRFPGCGLRFTDAHHGKHWADGGETSLRNLVLLCARHHRRVHEGGVRVCIDRDQQIVFFTPKGAVLAQAPPRHRGNVEVPTPEERPTRPAGHDGSARYQRDSHIPWTLEARALEAAAIRTPSSGPRPGPP